MMIMTMMMKKMTVSRASRFPREADEVGAQTLCVAIV